MTDMLQFMRGCCMQSISTWQLSAAAHWMDSQMTAGKMQSATSWGYFRALSVASAYFRRFYTNCGLFIHFRNDNQLCPLLFSLELVGY